MPKLSTTASSHSSHISFAKAHEVTYGLRITHRDAKTPRVISVRCEFCIYFGPEVDENAPRLRAKKVTKKTWTDSFQVDLYQKHHRSEHPLIWTQYQRSTEDQKIKF